MVAALLSRAAIVALTRPVPLGGCSWCLAAFYSATSFGAWEPPEDDDLYRSFLGSKCDRCRVAFEAVEVADREREHTDQLVAAGLAPVAARRIAAPRSSRRRWPPSAGWSRPGRRKGLPRPVLSGRPGRNPPA
jgi:hypothetical protein